jgi:VWFA-related protein
VSHSIRFGSVLTLMLLLATAGGQERRRPAEQGEEVVRVSSELVQTDVTVLDKRGRFVDGLTPEQFELRVDGRAVPLSFFEHVTAGSASEATQLAAAGARPTAQPAQGRKPLPPSPARGRVIFFFVDDVHLAPDSLARTRKSLTRFVDEQMTEGDLVAVVSTSGQVGFLQQLTDNKAVLHAAIGRLFSKRETDSYSSKVYISEVDANRVQNHRDQELFSYLVESTMNEYQMDASMATVAAMIVRDRARQINMNTRVAESRTLGGLMGLMRSSAPLAGRKLVFFVSDGFVLDYKKSNGPDVMRIVTEEAARVGAVVYTLDARGTIGEAGVDAARNDYPDFDNRTTGRNFFDEKMSQEPLETLAADTGGRAFLNNNAFNDAFSQAVAESSDYYLIAWRPDTDSQRAGKSRVEVSVRGRPDLRVQLRRRYVVTNAARVEKNAESVEKGAAAVEKNAAPVEKNAPASEKRDRGARTSSSTEGGNAAPSSAENELRAALASLYPRRDLPLALSVGYLDAPQKGTVLAASMQLDGGVLDFGEHGEGAQVDVLGIALDDRGSFATFKQVLAVPRDALEKSGERFVQWSQQLQLPPGLYQVRVAARDRRSGRTGSQSQWIEIPGATPGAVSLSSVFVASPKDGGASSPVNVGRRFARGSRLRFQSFVYGAGAGHADVTATVSVVRGGETVLTLPPRGLTADGAADPARIPFAGELSLEGLPAGRYVLRISAVDARTKSSASQQTGFTVE